MSFILLLIVATTIMNQSTNCAHKSNVKKRAAEIAISTPSDSSRLPTPTKRILLSPKIPTTKAEDYTCIPPASPALVFIQKSPRPKMDLKINTTAPVDLAPPVRRDSDECDDRIESTFLQLACEAITNGMCPSELTLNIVAKPLDPPMPPRNPYGNARTRTFVLEINKELEEEILKSPYITAEIIAFMRGLTKVATK